MYATRYDSETILPPILTRSFVTFFITLYSRPSLSTSDQFLHQNSSNIRFSFSQHITQKFLTLHNILHLSKGTYTSVYMRGILAFLMLKIQQNPKHADKCHPFLYPSPSKGRPLRIPNGIIVTCWFRRADINRRPNTNFLGEFLRKTTFKEYLITDANHGPISMGGQRIFGPGPD